ncbi:protein LOW PSII ACCUMULATION 3, chloroplastic isoform X2 [Abrus precatorius]|uniref:Protein LOW PSII ACCUMULATION 3, chloroplastic isoform X2 n=1 Tax=Abrus precatorius TaxID=3816 RepID=A0A8B8M1H3_ABRPR|nr:protein LOW PSII ACCUMULATION 3, chloroplastic isoform X2 [Abrus precatorius]
MVISNTIILSNSPVGTPSIPTSTVAKLETFSLKNDGVIRIRGVSASSVAPRNRKLASCSVSGGGNASVGIDVPFPTDYTQLLEQARVAVELAMKDNTQLMEIEFPTAGLGSVPGDGEGGIEMTESMQLIREFCDRFISSEKASRTRIFFPEASEVDFARQSAFSGSSFKLDYLTKPSFFEDFGFVEKVKMSDRVKTGDELFLVAYPYFNVNEMLVVEELYKEAVLNTERKLIIFNGELDRIRSGYYPPFFYPKLAALTKTFLPMMETVYYIHNFKGRNGGTLFRCYPGPWKVLRRVGSSNKYVCLHQQNSMPSLKEVALEILPTT